MYEAEFAEAKRVLDAFPVGHAQALQQRVRDGLIDGGTYVTDVGLGLDSVCTTCFYGTLALEEAGITDHHSAGQWAEQLQEALNIHLMPSYVSILEMLLAPIQVGDPNDEYGFYEREGGIQYGDTPATNALSAALDTWLTAYIAERVAVQA